jgi:hypothetical protein
MLQETLHGWSVVALLGLSDELCRQWRIGNIKNDV